MPTEIAMLTESVLPLDPDADPRAWSEDIRRAADTVQAPFEALPTVAESFRARVEAEARRVNLRYLEEVIEEYSFCPFSRAGRRAGITRQIVYYADSNRAEPLIELMCELATDPTAAVIQIIMPLIEVSGRDWSHFCQTLTRAGREAAGGPPVLAVAPLHPELEYDTQNAFSLIPLFRRAPDPTIQWVRLEALDGIYRRSPAGTKYIDPDDVPSLMAKPTPPPPLYDRIAESNLSMARRLRYETVASMLAAIADDGRRSYQKIMRDAFLGTDE